MKLDDKFRTERGTVYLTGIQALVRLPMDQMRRDRLSGLNTATFISGYEGSPLGGYDLISKSSTIPHQSDLSFYNFGMPVLYPGNTQEILDYGMLAIALSRFSGAWTAMKMVTNVCDGGATVEVDSERPRIAIPEGYEKHFDARLITPFTLTLEHEVNVRRLEAAREFARTNHLNQMFGAQDGARLGIATAGKPYYDLIQAMRDLGIRRED